MTNIKHFGSSYCMVTGLRDIFQIYHLLKYFVHLLLTSLMITWILAKTNLVPSVCRAWGSITFSVLLHNRNTSACLKSYIRKLIGETEQQRAMFSQTLHVCEGGFAQRTNKILLIYCIFKIKW